MRLPRVRFTVRWLMLAVAVVALFMGAIRLLQRRAYYLQLVAYNARWEAVSSRTELGWRGRLAALQATPGPGAAPAASQIEEARRTVEEAAAMKVLFTKRLRISERLASHPWEPVPPDPLDKRADHEEPLLILEPLPGLAYHLTSGSIAVLAISMVLIAVGTGSKASWATSQTSSPWRSRTIR